LGLGQDLGEDVLDSQLRCDRLSGSLVITGEHEHVESQIVQGYHRW